MKQQEEKQQAVSVVEFKEVKNELRNSTQLMSMMMRKLENQVPLAVV